jgi:molecular chaperone DnaJ
MPDPRGAPPGDLHVQTYIEVPKKLTPRQERLLRELAELEHTEVSPHRQTLLERIWGYLHPESASEASSGSEATSETTKQQARSQNQSPS